MHLFTLSWNSLLLRKHSELPCPGCLELQAGIAQFLEKFLNYVFENKQRLSKILTKLSNKTKQRLVFFVLFEISND